MHLKRIFNRTAQAFFCVVVSPIDPWLSNINVGIPVFGLTQYYLSENLYFTNGALKNVLISCIKPVGVCFFVLFCWTVDIWLV